MANNRRLILLNPHSHSFGSTVGAKIFRRKDFYKYSYFVEHFLKNQLMPTGILLDFRRSSFAGTPLYFLAKFKIVIFLEFLFWLALNRINPFRVKVYFSIKSLETNKDVLFDFAKSIVDGQRAAASAFLEYNGLKLLHLTHYFQDPKLLQEKLSNQRNLMLCAEANLTKSIFFQKYFPDCPSVYILPFVAKEKFRIALPNPDKVKKCLAIGSIGRLKSQAVMDFYPFVDAIQPMRAIILRESKRSPEIFTCRIKGPNTDPGSDHFLRRFTSCFNLKRLKDLFWTASEKKGNEFQYFNFNLIDDFSGHTMFIAPEEITGLPSINFVEGMSQGCLYLGASESIYQDYGMVAGFHYVSYKELDFKDLEQTVKYLMKNSELSSFIGKNGREFALREFSAQNVSKKFVEDIYTMDNPSDSKWIVLKRFS